MKVAFFSLLLAVTLLFIIQESHAETFRWVDEFGKIRIGIKPSAEPKNIKKEKGGNMEISPSSPVIVSPVEPKVIMEHATSSAKTAKAPEATPVVATPEIVAPIKPPVSIQPPVPAQKTSVKKPNPVKEKVPIKKPTPKKLVVEKKPKRVAPVKKRIAEEKSAKERNEEMCGVFTGYVNDYEEKVRNCSSNICDIYKRSLTRYKKKQKSYCK